MRNQLRQFLTEILMSVLGGVKTEEVMAGWQTVFISWLLVVRQWPDSLRFNVKSLHHRRDPDDYWEINSSSAVILDVHNRTQTAAKTEHAEKKKHIGTMYIPMDNYTRACALTHRSAGLAMIC